MRDLNEAGTAARLRLAADEHGWKRDLGTFQGRDPRGRVLTVIRWRRADGLVFDSGCPELMPSPMRESVRALLVSWFDGECPCCDAIDATLEDDELRGDALLESTQLNPVTGGASGIVHTDECPLRPVAQMSRLVNTVGTEASGAPLN